MAAYEILLLNTAIPQIQAAQSGDTYVVPRDIAFSTVANLANGTNLLPSLTFSSDTNTGIYREGADALGFTAGGGTNQMVLTSTGLGIGTNNPSDKLHIVGTGTNAGNGYLVSRFMDATNAKGVFLGYDTDELAGTIYGVNFLTFQTYNGSAWGERMRLDSSGNLGLGVTPSAWRSGDRAFDIGGISALADVQAAATRLVSNAYGVSGGVYIYKTNNFASYYNQQSGQHQWYTAPSGFGYGTAATSLTSTQNGNSYTIVTAGTTDFTLIGAANNNVGTTFTKSGGTGAGTGTVSQNISFTQAMTLDANGDLGVGTTSIPSGGASTRNVSIHNSNSAATYFKLSNGATGNTASDGFDLVMGTSSDAYIFNRENGPMLFGTNSTERARITSGGIFQVSSGGSVQVGGTAARATTAGTNRLDIFNGTAPVGTLTDGISIYSSSGEAYVMDAAGNATLFSPHDTETNEWIFKSKHTPTGKVLKIDVERLLKFVNDHFGLDAVHEFVEK